MTELLVCESCPALVEKLHSVHLTPDTTSQVCEACLNRHMSALTAAYDASKKHTPLIGVGDVFNTEQRSFIEIREQINSDSSIIEKDFAFQSALTERYELLKRIVTEAPQQLAAVNYLLKDLGEKMRTDVRERIKATDDKYMVALPKPVKVSMPKASKIDTALRFITELAKKKNCTIDEAKRLFALGQID